MNLHRHIGIENSLCGGIHHHFHILALLQEIYTIDQIGRNVDLLKGLVVHEDHIITILIKILIGTTLHAHILKLFADIEATLQNASVDHIFQRHVHDGVALTWLTVQKIDTEIELAIHADAGALLDVL